MGDPQASNLPSIKSYLIREVIQGSGPQVCPICRQGDPQQLTLGGSVLEGGAQTVNESFMEYFRDNEGWQGFSKDDIDYWMQYAIQPFEQHGRRNFKMVADSCKVELRSPRLNNNRLAINKGIMHIEG